MDLFTERTAYVQVEIKVPPGVKVEDAEAVVKHLLSKATFEEIQLLNELLKDSMQKKLAISIARAKYGHLIF